MEGPVLSQCFASEQSELVELQHWLEHAPSLNWLGMSQMPVSQFMKKKKKLIQSMDIAGSYNYICHQDSGPPEIFVKRTYTCTHTILSWYSYTLIKKTCTIMQANVHQIINQEFAHVSFWSDQMHNCWDGSGLRHGQIITHFDLDKHRGKMINLLLET